MGSAEMAASNGVMRGICMLLLAVTMALSFQPDDASSPLHGAVELGEAMEVRAAKSAPVALRPEDKMGLRILDEYRKFNSHLADKEEDLRNKLMNPPEATKGLSYHKVPGYKYSYLSKTMHGKSRASCELVCNTYSACKSYSYNRKTRTCVWS